MEWQPFGHEGWDNSSVHGKAAGGDAPRDDAESRDIPTHVACGFASPVDSAFWLQESNLRRFSRAAAGFWAHDCPRTIAPHIRVSYCFIFCCFVSENKTTTQGNCAVLRIRQDSGPQQEQQTIVVRLTSLDCWGYRPEKNLI